jgi:hypothetical protein
MIRTKSEVVGSTGEGGTVSTGDSSISTSLYRCECYNEWTGLNCNTKNGDLDNCPDRCTNGQGECIKKIVTLEDGGDGSEEYTCSCYHPYTGLNCAASLCPNHCGGRGKCLEDGCSCIDGWTGPSCQKPLCSRLNDCNGHGTCIESGDWKYGGKCQCDPGFDETEDCSASGCPMDCSGHGSCGSGKFPYFFIFWNLHNYFLSL